MNNRIFTLALFNLLITSYTMHASAPAASSTTLPETTAPSSTPQEEQYSLRALPLILTFLEGVDKEKTQLVAQETAHSQQRALNDRYKIARAIHTLQPKVDEKTIRILVETEIVIQHRLASFEATKKHKPLNYNVALKRVKIDTNGDTSSKVMDWLQYEDEESGISINDKKQIKTILDKDFETYKGKPIEQCPIM